MSRLQSGGASLNNTGANYFSLLQSQSLLKWMLVPALVGRGFPVLNIIHVAGKNKSQSLLKWMGDSLTQKYGLPYYITRVAILVKVDGGFPDSYV